MPESESPEMKEEQTIVARPRNSVPKAIAVIALIVAVVSLLLNAYLIGVVQSSDNTIRDLQSDVSEQQNTADTLNSAISDLESTVGDLGSQISDLENDIDDLRTQVSDLEQTVGDLESQISDLEDTVDSLESRISDLENATNGGTTGPNVQLAQAEAHGGNSWKIAIAGVSEAKDIDSFKAIVIKNGAIWRTLDPLGTGSESNITFTDLGGEGKLTTGDYFMVQCDPGASYEICIVWRDSGNVKGSESWAT